MPSDAVVVAFANVRQLMDSNFRQQVKGLEPANGETGQAEFRAETGIDIERDIDYVVACMLSSPGDTAGAADQVNGFVLAHGIFNQPRIEALLREKGGVEQTYKGKAIFVHGPDPTETAERRHDRDAGEAPRRADGRHLREQRSGCHRDAGRPAARDRHPVGQRAQRRHRQPLDLRKMIDSVSDGNTWAVGRFDVLSKRAQLPAQVASQLPPITWVKASGHVNGGVSGTVSVEARDQAAAQNLRQVINGLKALAALQTGAKPEMTALLQSILVSGDDTTVSVSFTLPSATIDALKAGMKAHVEGQ